MSKLSEVLDPVRQAYGRLSEREQFLVLGGAGALLLLVMLIVGLTASSAIATAERRVKVKTGQLEQALALQSDFTARKAEHEARLMRLKSSNVKLVSLVEEASRQSGVQIGQLRPEDGEPSPDGVVESRVDLRASGLSVDRLQDFLSRIEQSPGLVVVKRLKVDRPYRRDTLELELTVTTYKTKGP